MICEFYYIIISYYCVCKSLGVTYKPIDLIIGKYY